MRCRFRAYAQIPAFKSNYYEKEAYDRSLFALKQAVAHYIPDVRKWHVGEISSLNYRKAIWVSYPGLPRQPGNKFTEYSHAFRESDYGILWCFLKRLESDNIDE